MRSAFFTAPLVAAAYAATTTDTGYTLVSEISGGKTVISTYYYSNPATKYLTQTNSDGVITGMPSAAVTTQPQVVTTQPQAVTSQPPVATIPAGLPTGFDTITINATAGLTSFTISVGTSTTELIGAPNVRTGTAGASSFVPAGQTNGPHHKPTGTAKGNGQGTASSSASASATTSGAASNVKAASAGMLGLGALVAAIL